MDPITGNLFALVRDRRGDSLVLELTRRFLREPGEEPKTLFRLEEFQEDVMEGRQPRGSVQFPNALLPEELDFVAFDNLGRLYMGAGSKDLVLEFELDRPDVRHMVGVSAVVVDDAEGGTSPSLRIQAWTKSP